MKFFTAADSHRSNDDNLIILGISTIQDKNKLIGKYLWYLFCVQFFMGTSFWNAGFSVPLLSSPTKTTEFTKVPTFKMCIHKGQMLVFSMLQPA